MSRRWNVIRIFVEELPERRGRFVARLGNGQVVVRSSRQPFLDAARVLLAEGADPAEMLVMMRGQTQSLSGPIGKAAKLTVDENCSPPRFREWRPYAGPSARTDEKPDDANLDPSVAPRAV